MLEKLKISIKKEKRGFVISQVSSEYISGFINKYLICEIFDTVRLSPALIFLSFVLRTPQKEQSFLNNILFDDCTKKFSYISFSNIRDVIQSRLLRIVLKARSLMKRKDIKYF